MAAMPAARREIITSAKDVGCASSGGFGLLGSLAYMMLDDVPSMLRRGNCG